jgi:hypothetical protein
MLFPLIHSSSFRKKIYNKVGRWLSRVLHCPDVCLGDSPKAAGMMELLTTKGSWIASVRWAYQKCIADGVGDAADGDSLLDSESANTAPTTAWCTRVASRFSKIWEESLQQVPEFSAKQSHSDGIEMSGDKEKGSLDDKLSMVVSGAVMRGKMAAIEWAGEDTVVSSMPPDARDQWVVCIIDNFLNGDIFTAMSEFLLKAHGSFGLQVISSNQPGTAVIAAKGQTMRMAVLPKIRTAIWGEWKLYEGFLSFTRVTSFSL